MSDSERSVSLVERIFGFRLDDGVDRRRCGQETRRKISKQRKDVGMNVPEGMAEPHTLDGLRNEMQPRSPATRKSSLPWWNAVWPGARGNARRDITGLSNLGESRQERKKDSEEEEEDDEVELKVALSPTSKQFAPGEEIVITREGAVIQKGKLSDKRAEKVQQVAEQKAALKAEVEAKKRRSKKMVKSSGRKMGVRETGGLKEDLLSSREGEGKSSRSMKGKKGVQEEGSSDDSSDEFFSVLWV